MILSNITEAHEYLPSLNLDLANDRFTDFFRRAQQWLVDCIIGTDIEETLEIDIAVGATDSHADLRKLCQRVIAERALLDAIPEMDMQLTEAGFAVQHNDNFTPASSQRVDRLIAKMPDRIKNDVDALVRYLWNNSLDGEAYEDWRSTEQYAILTSAFMPEWRDFYHEPMVNKAMTYDEFYSAIPTMAQSIKKIAAYFVSEEEIDRLLELYRDGSTMSEHRMAIVNLRDVAIYALKGDIRKARNSAMNARNVMLNFPTYFTAFTASDAYNEKNINLDGGKVVNFL